MKPFKLCCLLTQWHWEAICHYKEALAAPWIIKKFTHNILGTVFTLDTDHLPLVVPLLSSTDLSKLPRRILRIHLQMAKYFPEVNICSKDTSKDDRCLVVGSYLWTGYKTTMHLSNKMKSILIQSKRLWFMEIKTVQSNNKVCILQSGENLLFE